MSGDSWGQVPPFSPCQDTYAPRLRILRLWASQHALESCRDSLQATEVDVTV